MKKRKEGKTPKIKKMPKNVKRSPLWDVFSEYIRRRDKGRCFTCPKVQEWNSGTYDAGHFQHAKLNTYFLETNVHGQCRKCNTFLHGNQGFYRKNMVDKYGEQKVLLLEKYEKPRPMTSIEYFFLLAEYKKKLSEL